MNEGTWRTTDDPVRLLGYAKRFAPARKLRLFGCACLRRGWWLLPPECREAVEIVERAAQRLITQSEWARAVRLATQSAHRNPRSPSVRAVALLFEEGGVLDPAWRPLCSSAVQCHLARCVFGNPFRPAASASSSAVWARAET